MSEFKIEKVEVEVNEPIQSMPAMYQLFDIVEMEDEEGNKVKIKQQGMHISREDLMQQEETLEYQLEQVKAKIAMIDEIE
jgi:hypothetical protein